MVLPSGKPAVRAVRLLMADCIVPMVIAVRSLYVLKSAASSFAVLRFSISCLILSMTPPSLVRSSRAFSAVARRPSRRAISPSMYSCTVAYFTPAAVQLPAVNAERSLSRAATWFTKSLSAYCRPSRIFRASATEASKVSKVVLSSLAASRLVISPRSPFRSVW